MSVRYRVLLADFLDEAGIEAPVFEGLADWTLARGWSEEDLAGHVEDADAIVLFHDIPRLGEATFRRAGRCKVVVRAGVGFNNVDLEAAGRAGILVCNVPDYGTEEVADHAILLTLAVARRLMACDRSIREGVWDYRRIEGAPRLRGETFGVVGCGRIGTATALRAKALGMRALFYDPHSPRGLDKALGIERAERLEDLLERSLVVSLHCYLDATTRHLIDAAALGRMRRDAILVNTARGPVVDQEALVEALAAGRIFGAGLDVFEREPFDEPRLTSLPNVVLTPHVAFYSAEGFDELRRKAAEEAARVLRGERPWNLVNREWLTGTPRSAI